VKNITTGADVYAKIPLTPALSRKGRGGKKLSLSKNQNL